MNKLSYKIEVDSMPRHYPSVFKIVIDGVETNYYFDVAGLDLSRTKGGVFPMFICGCGYMGCTGYYVQVDIGQDEITWSKFFSTYYDYDNPNQNKEEESFVLIKNFNTEEGSIFGKPPLRFAKKEYNELVDLILAEIPKYKEQQEVYLGMLESYKKGDRYHM